MAAYKKLQIDMNYQNTDNRCLHHYLCLSDNPLTIKSRD